jgi:hypothetical protein
MTIRFNLTSEIVWVITAVLLAAVFVIVAVVVIREIRHLRQEQLVRQLLAMFVPTGGQVSQEPRELLLWFPIAKAGRRMFPEAFQKLDSAFESRFPYSESHVNEVHARLTADWLSWEREHDFNYKLKKIEAEQELVKRNEAETSVGRARLAKLEREQLSVYQKRYEDYVRTSKAFESLMKPKNDK